MEPNLLIEESEVFMSKKRPKPILDINFELPPNKDKTEKSFKDKDFDLSDISMNYFETPHNNIQLEQIEYKNILGEINRVQEQDSDEKISDEFYSKVLNNL